MLTGVGFGSSYRTRYLCIHHVAIGAEAAESSAGQYAMASRLAVVSAVLILKWPCAARSVGRGTDEIAEVKGPSSHSVAESASQRTILPGEYPGKAESGLGQMQTASCLIGRAPRRVPGPPGR